VTDVHLSCKKYLPWLVVTITVTNAVVEGRMAYHPYIRVVHYHITGILVTRVWALCKDALTFIPSICLSRMRQFEITRYSPSAGHCSHTQLRVASQSYGLHYPFTLVNITAVAKHLILMLYSCVGGIITLVGLTIDDYIGTGPVLGELNQVFGMFFKTEDRFRPKTALHLQTDVHP
jgi:hypothetical protein